jgi:aspartate racemase
MKTIGVLGGFGPQATMNLEALIHEASQRLIPQHAGSGYPPMVVYYYRHAPVLVDDTGLAPLFPIQPDPRLLEAAKRIGELADFIIISANAPHIFAEQIQEAAGCELLSMIDLVLAELKRQGWEKAGVLALGEPRVYTAPLDELGIAHEAVEGELRARLDRAIFALMAGQDDESSTAAALEAVETLRKRDVDGIIMGCTEIPLLLGERAKAADLINPAWLLAEAAVRNAAEKEGQFLAGYPPRSLDYVE